jgi:SM-20-related protein
MDRLKLFANLGLVIFKNFFDAELCARIQSEVRSATDLSTAMVHKDGRNLVVDEEVRKTQKAKVPEPIESLVKSRFLALKPKLECHFSLTLTDCDAPQFLLYRQGSYFLPHKDSITQTDAPEYLKRRQVSTVLFLNGEAEKPQQDYYCGGALTFYGLLKEPRWAEYGFPLTGETGLLVAFPSDVMHEVQLVTHGERYTIVSWFLQ